MVPHVTDHQGEFGGFTCSDSATLHSPFSPDHQGECKEINGDEGEFLANTESNAVEMSDNREKVKGKKKKEKQKKRTKQKKKKWDYRRRGEETKKEEKKKTKTKHMTKKTVKGKKIRFIVRRLRKRKQ